MRYPWGSPNAIPELLGEPGDGGPVAEVWFGAHPKAPSHLLLDGASHRLDEALRSRPELLGEAVYDRFSGRLPFLVKLLAAARPLSVQVHPCAPLAAAGFAAEEDSGLPLGDPLRTYKDPFHKPEVMIALAPTETLVGFRSLEGARELLSALGVPWASGVAGRLDHDMRPALRAMLDRSAWSIARHSVVARCRQFAGRDRAFALVDELDAHFPGDPGVAAPLLLNCVRYSAGQALFVPAGELHAHVSGFGVEVMAASDNVIRAGLTSKYVDPDALLAAVNPHPSRPQLMPFSSGSLTPPVDEFAVSRVLAGEYVGGQGPRILLSLSAAGCAVAGIALPRGRALFLASGERPILERGEALMVATAAASHSS